MVELQNKLSEESKKADKMEFEYKRVKEKVDSLQKEKDVRRPLDRCAETGTCCRNDDVNERICRVLAEAQHLYAVFSYYFSHSLTVLLFF